MPKIIFTKAEAILHLKKYLNFTFHCDIEIADKNHDNLTFGDWVYVPTNWNKNEMSIPIDSNCTIQAVYNTGEYVLGTPWNFQTEWIQNSESKHIKRFRMVY